MKFLPLIWAALKRKRARSLFTLVSITVAFLLFGMMTGISAGFDQFLDNIPANRIMVTPRFGGRLPFAHVDQIARLKGVTHIVPSNFIFGYYQDQKNRLNVSMTDERLVDVVPEMGITADMFAALKHIQTGAIVSQDMAEVYGWTVGQTVPIESDIAKVDGTRTWTFTIVSIVPVVDSISGGFMIGNHAYLDEGRADERNRGMAFDFRLLIDDPAQVGEVSNAIETMFANSAVAVAAMPERVAFEQGLQGFLDLEFFTRAVSAAALFMIVFLTGNVMAQSVRERIPEFAVMKTVGFTDRGIFLLVLAEAAIPCLIGACLGLALAQATPALARALFPGTTLLPVITPAVIAYALGAAILVAAVSGLPAAWRARRLNVIDALAGR
jgi:putative ABC transport system permease protein